MPSPFPGMDPYLEDPAIWSGVHAAVLAAMFDRLGSALRPRYAVRYEERVYVTGEVELMDEDIHEPSLVIRDVKDKMIVTVIELLSPTNKVPNSFGRESFLQKRREIKTSASHWLEIDLLRDGIRTTNFRNIPESDYQIYLSRAGDRRRGLVWPIRLQDRLPVIGIPLRGDDPDLPLDMQELLAKAIERGSYDLETDYSVDPVPPLTPALGDWAKELIGKWKPEV